MDANVVIAAFASRGLCESVFELCLSGHELFLGTGLLDEITRNLRRKIKLLVAVMEDIRTLLQEHAIMMEPAPVPGHVCRDPDDAKILGLAVASGADCVVTGDADPLVLEEYRGIPILSPRSFSEMIRSRDRR
ncbi:MAG: putative toxin-antitoxin system toxin component, PIN family [Sedimentisphaerales bacterium]|nr:putative toxin-antitoxin system toxin component, PIN family [Sedimentisphaerales bacterium]